MTQRQRLGRLGEDLARRRLEADGHTILETNYRTRSGEIDIVSLKNGILVFVEVRTRRGAAYVSPKESLTPKKRSRMAACAQEYIEATQSENREWRIDVVAVELDPQGRLVSRYFPDGIQCLQNRPSEIARTV